MGTPVRGAVRQGLGAEPGAGEVPGLSGVQGDLGVVQARRAGTARVTATALVRRAVHHRRTHSGLAGAGGLGHGHRPCAPGRPRRSPTTSRARRATTSRWRRPGAGKTTFALSVGRRAAGTPHRRPDHRGGADRAPQAPVGGGRRTRRHPDRPDVLRRHGQDLADFVGIAVTYAGVAVNPLAMRIRTERFKTLVILDEVHHAGDALSWGEGVREAFEPAHAAAGADRHAVPLRRQPDPVRHLRAGRRRRARARVADFTYGYGHALADHVVRPVLFMAYSGDLQWRTRAGDEVAARLGEPLTKDLTAQALRTALDPAGSWIPSVLAAADRRLTEVRRHVPDAGGLVIATDQDSARAYADAAQADQRRDADASCCPTRRPASKRIAAFTDGDAAGWSRCGWSPRASTCRGSPSASTRRPPSTPLFFAQAVGRFVRARAPRRDRVGVPAVGAARCSAYAAELEVAARPRARPAGSATRTTSSPPRTTCSPGPRQARRASDELLGSFEALGSRGALRPGALRRRRVRPRGRGARRLRGGDGLPRHPRLLEPDQVRELLHRRQRPSAPPSRAPRATTTRRASRRHEQLAILRRELNGLVAAWHHRTGQAHGVTHAALRKELRRARPPRSPTPSQLHARIDRLREWAAQAFP